MARISGVAPLTALASMFAPALRRYSTTSLMPLWHAKCSGVHLKLSVALTSALKQTDDYAEKMNKFFNDQRSGSFSTSALYKYYVCMYVCTVCKGL